jgi:hypothetical protein
LNDLFDSVITWVDGNDPVHRTKRNSYLLTPESGATSCGILDWRFVDVGEVKYCIYSIRKFAPWIRNIYLVTDNQCPKWLTKEKQNELGVFVIDHRIIFRDHLHCLPTFNTMSINSLLHKIPGLANNYIVLNDDCFFIDKVYIDDFFVDKKNIIRGQLKPITPGFVKRIKRIFKHFLNTKSFKNFLINKSINPHIIAAKTVGINNKYFEIAHAPDSNRVDVLNDFYSDNRDYLEQNVTYKFRNENQTSSAAIFPHIMIKNNRAILHDGSDAVMIIPRYKGLLDQRQKFNALKLGNHGKKFLCFQDLAFLKQENPVEFHEVIDWLEATIMS